MNGLFHVKKDFYFFLATFLAGEATISRKAFPGLNFGTFFAGILIEAPVLGFLPERAFLFMIENVPKPIRVTLPPPDNSELIAPTAALIAFSASTLVKPVSAATLAVSCCLFNPIKTSLNG